LFKQITNIDVLITKDEKEAKEEFQFLKKNGFNTISFPTIELSANDDFSNPVETDINFDYLVFTSVNAVKFFAASKLYKKLKDKLLNCKILAIGSKTKQICQENNFEVNLMPKSFSSDGIIDLFLTLNIQDKNILIPSSSISDNKLKDKLESLGANVEQLPIYKNTIKHYSKNEIDFIKKNKPHIFVFTSPSNLGNFIKLLQIENPKKYFADILFCVIGNKTKSSAELLEINVHICPKVFNLKSVFTEIIKKYNI